MVVAIFLVGLLVGFVIARMGIAMARLHHSNTRSRYRGMP